MAVQNIAPPFRADHVGSLKRPDDLLKKRDEFDAGHATKADLAQVEDQAIKDIVQMQQKVGIKAITDGEFRRHMFFDGFHEHLDGMTLVPEPSRDIFIMHVPDVKAFLDSPAAKPAATMICTGKISRKQGESAYMREFAYLKTLVPPEEVKNLKITLAAPEWFHLRHLDHAFKGVYDSTSAYLSDIAKAYREELAELYKLGCRNIQMDDPLLAYFCAVPMLEGMKKDGVDTDKLLDEYIQCYNDCLRDVPDDMMTGLHLCRGNFVHGMHFSEGGYEHISRKMFNDMKFKTFYLEYDTARAGGFEPLEDLPAPKTVVLGLVSSKVPKLEDESYLVKRIEEAASFVAKGSNQSRDEAMKRICLSPQCGMASHSEGNDITRDDVVNKLSLVVKVAKKVWPDA